MEHEVDDYTNRSNSPWDYPQELQKGLVECKIRGRLETIPTTWLLKQARILRRILEM